MKRSSWLLAILFGLLLVTGCNIFEPFHSEGKSDDVEVLLEDAKAALANDQPEKALEYLDKAMRIDPDHPAVRYYHAVAVMRVHGIELSAFFDAFKGAEHSTQARMSVFSKPKQGVYLFQLTQEELQNLLDAFSQVHVDLDPLVEGLHSGNLSYSDVPHPDDVFLSDGVSLIVTAMLYILDNDTTKGEFSLDERVSILNENGAYQIQVTDPHKTSAELDAEIDSLIALYWVDYFEAGRQNLADYYNYLHGDPLITLPAIPAPLPFTPDNSPSGDLLRVVDKGLRALYDEMMD